MSILLRARAANEARVVPGRVVASDGVIVHGIDRVLLPPGYDEAAFEDTASEVRIDARNDTAGSADAVSLADDEGSAIGPAQDGSNPDFASEIVESDPAPLPPIPEPDPAAGPARSAGGIDADDPATTDAEGRTVVTVAYGDDPTAEIAGASEGSGAARPIGTTDGNFAGDGTPDTTVTIARPQTARAPDERGRPAEPSGRTGIEAGSDEADRRNIPSEQPSPADEPETIPDTDLTRDVISVAELLGRTMIDESGSELGTISDLLVTLDDTRIRTVVLESGGGFFGIGEESTHRRQVSQIVIDPLDGAVRVEAAAFGTGE